MKLLILFFGISLTAYALEGRSQQVTLRVKAEPLAQVLDAIYQQSGYNVVAEPRLLQLAKPVTLEAIDQSLAEVLERCFAGQPITYTLSAKDRAIVVRERVVPNKRPVGQDPTKPSVPHIVTGTVIDSATKQPMAGVNVVVKRTNAGTFTNASGRYALEVEGDDILFVSFLGYTSQEVPVQGRGSIDIALAESVSTLQEVEVNAGYWTVKERERTGNIARVTAETIEQQPIANPLQSMQGRMAGVHIVQRNGNPGSGFDIQIRGRNSLRTEGNHPLYVVDGVPFASQTLSAPLGGVMQNDVSPLNSINPMDIESIEVLKDADATAIYGSRGANGVVLIATKKGNVGKPSVDFNVQKGIGRVARKMDLLTTSEYLEMRKEGLRNDNLWPLQPELHQYVPDLFVWDTTRYTDWQKELIGGTAQTNNAQLSFRGGDAQTQFLVSGNYYSETSVFPGDFSYMRGTGQLNLSHTSDNQRFKINLSANYSGDNNRLPRADLTWSAVTLPPVAPALFDEEGNINWENNSWFNPLAEYTEQKYQATNNNLIINTTLNYRLLEGLSAKANVGYNHMQLNEIGTSPSTSVRPDQSASFMPYSYFGNGTVKTWILEPQVEYVKALGRGDLIILAGATFQETAQNRETLHASGFSSDALIENIRAASDIEASIYTQNQYRYNAFFTRINYAFLEKYILNLTARRDGSSRFGPDKQFGTFGAIGAAWIFSNEHFISNGLPFISFGKFRGSLGTTGSDNIGDYEYLSSYRSTDYTYDGISGLIPSRLQNLDYSWETNRKLEAAMDVGLFKDRLFVSTSWYRNQSSNQLVGYPLSVVTGMPSVQFNLPATVENMGWEFVVNTINIRNASFLWTTSLNATLPKNKLLAYPDLEKSSYANTYMVGKSLFAKKGFVSTGLDSETGLIAYLDLNGDGLITYPDDFDYIGEVTQSFFGGATNSIHYRGIELDFMLQLVKQTGFFLTRYSSMPGAPENVHKSFSNHWRKPGDIAAHQKVSWMDSTPHSNLMQSDLAYEDASFIRLKNVSLSYNIPSNITKKINTQSLRVYLQGQNILTFDNYKGLDPENQNSNALPSLRVFSVGVQAVFQP